MDNPSELQKIEADIKAQENLRGLIPDEQIENIIATLQAQRETLIARADQGGQAKGGQWMGLDRV